MDLKKKCVTCSRQFIPSSRHLSCPMCRKRSYKNLCKCGTLKNKAYETCYKCSILIGPRNKSWKGGKTMHRQGYRYLYLSKGKYVFEHVLVMEKSIGRKLLKGENVHHINGIKDDNRIKNLELWVRPQPSGIRKSDAVKWAKRILKLYSKPK